MTEATLEMTHQVLVAPPFGGRARWVRCTVVGRTAYVMVPNHPMAFDVVTEAGETLRMCNPSCVRVAS